MLLLSWPSSASDGDSLHQKLAEIEKSAKRSPQQAVQALQALLAVAKENDPSQAWIIEQDIVQNWLMLGRYEEAQEVMPRLMKEATFTANKDSVELLQTAGALAMYLNDYQTAEQHLTQARQLVAQTEDQKLQIEVELQVGWLFILKEDIEQAFSILPKTYERAQQLGDQETIGSAESILGSIYSFIGDEEQATEHLQKSVAIAKAEGLVYSELIDSYNLALSLVNQKRFDEALVAYDSMLKLSEQTADLRNIYFAYFGIAMVHSAKKDFDMALKYIDKSAEYLFAVEDAVHNFDAHNERAYLLAKTGQGTVALKELEKAEQVMKSQNLEQSHSVKLSYYNVLAVTYKALKEFEKAVQAQNDWIDTYIAFRDEEREQKINTLQVKFDTQKAKLETALLQQQKELSEAALVQATQHKQLQWTLIIVISVISFVLCVMLYRQLQNRRMLHKMANTDSLTELYNRRFVFGEADKLFSQSQQHATALSVVMFDIDHFKAINDSYGHAAGDALLKHVAKISKQCLRDNDVLARIGGEEFLAVLNGVPTLRAQEIAERLRMLLDQTQVEIEGRMVHCTASFGVASSGEDAKEFREVLQQADEALYQAKAQGRNQVVVYAAVK